MALRPGEPMHHDTAKTKQTKRILVLVEWLLKTKENNNHQIIARLVAQACNPNTACKL